jgi:hypothetical protein
MFVDAVERGRTGKMTADDVRATEARMYAAEQAIDLGLADKVMTLDGALARLAETNSPRSHIFAQSENASTMSISQEQLDAAVAAARADGAKAEGARISAILGSASAEGRDTLARHLAFNTSMDAAAAEGILSASAKVAPQPPAGTTTNAAHAAAVEGVLANAAAGVSGDPGAGAGADTTDTRSAAIDEARANVRALMAARRKK